MAGEASKDQNREIEGLNSNSRAILLSLITGYVARSGEAGLGEAKMKNLISKAKQLATMIPLMLLMLTTPVMAQTKPLGVWDLGPTCRNVKSWMQMSTIATFDDFVEARKCSERTGIKWIIQFGWAAPLGTPVDAEIIRVQDKLRTSQLGPHVIAMTFVEEWQGLMKKKTIAERDGVWQFGSEQQRKLKQAFPSWLMLYVDQLVNNDPQYGVDLYMPLPLYTDVFVMELYNGNRDVLNLYFDYVKQTIAIPMAVVGQGFYDDRFPLDPKPTQEYVEWWKTKLNDPKVIAGLLFTWRNRAPGTITGLESLPVVESWFVGKD